MKRVLFHIDEVSKWDLLLKNVQNLMEASEDALEIRVVANAEAVMQYINVDAVPLLKELIQLDVIFIACNNALRAHSILLEQLPSYIVIVPAGVLELVNRQYEGFSYIKP